MFMAPQPVRRKRRRPAKTRTLPPPTRGWVTEENIVAGSPGTARQLINWFPDADVVGDRRGFAQHSDTEGTAPIETLISYHKSDGTQKLFAVADDTIYDATSSTATATTITNLSNARLQYVNFAATTTNYIFAVNGEDSALTYDGSSWANPSITNITSADIINVAIFKRRLYFVMTNSLQFAYLPVNAVAGAAGTFDLGPEFSKGGYLMAIGVWSIDGGDGQDDIICFLTSEGQVSIYQGDDPGDANAWSKIGTYDLPRPIGRRCVLKVGPDVYLVTEEGIIPLKETLSMDTAAASVKAVTRNIQSAVNDAATRYKGNFGWQLIGYPEGRMAILNVPITENATSRQYVMNTITGAWCEFRGMDANCWAVLGSRIYFGGNER